MAVPSLANVEITSTFQIWLNRTNDLVDIVKTKALTASVSNTDITIGNATLEGTFTANNLIAFNLLRADAVSSKLGGSSPVTFSSPITANTSIQTALALSAAQGARSTYSSTTETWDVGFENTSTSAFVISKSTAVTPTFKITTDGEVIASKFTGAFDGVANTATRLATARTISMTGDVSWSIAGGFDGTTNVTATGTIQDNVVSNSKIRQSAAYSVIGNGTASTANVADLTASLDGQVLRRAGTALGFGAIDLSNAEAVTGILPPSRGGTGVSSAGYPTGRVLFGGPTGSITTNSAFFWDNTNARLGINDPTPTRTLVVGGTFGVTGTSTLSALNAGATSVSTLSVTSTLAGAVLIGQPSTTQPQTTILMTIYGAMRANGNITAFAGITTSDEKLKKNIQPINSALDIVEKLRGVTFEWKDKNYGGKTYGLIAQEVEKIVPELVHENENVKGVAYANIVSILIEAVKELKLEVEKLKV